MGEKQKYLHQQVSFGATATYRAVRQKERKAVKRVVYACVLCVWKRCVLMSRRDFPPGEGKKREQATGTANKNSVRNSNQIRDYSGWQTPNKR